MDSILENPIFKFFMNLAKVIWLVLAPIWASAQIVITNNAYVNAQSSTFITSTLGIENESPNLDFGNVTLKLTASPTLKNTSTNSIPVGSLELANTVDCTMDGWWGIKNQLTFTSGKLLTSMGKLVYFGSSDTEGNAQSYVQGPFYVQGNAGKRTFPVGDNTGYAPLVLQDIDPADANAEIGVEIVTTAPFRAPTAPIKEIFQDRFWQISVSNSGTGGYSGSRVSLSKNGTDVFFEAGGNPVIVEHDAAGSDNNLGGTDDVLFATSDDKTSPNGGVYGIGRTEKTQVIVHRVITPNDEDAQNNVLYIVGIDSYPNNTVTILDRWGVFVKEWSNFANYPIGSGPETSNFNFKGLAVGNYIVIVKYTNGGKEESVRQMVSVLK